MYDFLKIHIIWYQSHYHVVYIDVGPTEHGGMLRSHIRKYSDRLKSHIEKNEFLYI